MIEYQSQVARDAQRFNYGDQRYWDYLERSAFESSGYWRGKGEWERARSMLTRSLGEALRGNDGE